MMTRSGVHVTPDNDAVPTLDDIAYALARAPRFAGHSIVPWTVAEHLLACYSYANSFVRSLGPGHVLRPKLALPLLLHDAHEAVTGDVPTPWKTPSFRVLQADLDRRIERAFGLDVCALASPFVKAMDRAMLAAEAYVVCAKAIRPHFDAPVREAIEAVERVMAHYPRERTPQVIAHQYKFQVERRLAARNAEARP